MSSFRGLSWKNKHRENILKVLIVALRVEQMMSSFIMFSFLYSFYTLISKELFSRHLVKQQHWWLKLTAQNSFLYWIIFSVPCVHFKSFTHAIMSLLCEALSLWQKTCTNKYVLPCFGEWVPNCGPAPHKGSGRTRGISNCSIQAAPKHVSVTGKRKKAKALIKVEL